MKKTITKALTLILALALAFTLSLSAFAIDGDYFESPELYNYEEEETTIENSVQAVIGTQIDGEGAGQNNYNIYAALSDVDYATAQDILDSLGDYETVFKQELETQFSSMGYSATFNSFLIEIESDSLDYYEYVNVECDYILSDGYGNSQQLYQEIAMIPAEGYVVQVTVTNVISAQECKSVFDDVIDCLWIEDYNLYAGMEDDLYDIFGEEYDGEVDEYTEKLLGVSMGLAIAIIVGIILIPIIIIVIIIVVIVKSSKKKKQQQMQAQQQYNQYNQYGYNPYGQQPQQNNGYNPYGQQPQQNNGYNPYGQQPQQNNGYNPYSNPPSNNNEE